MDIEDINCNNCAVKNNCNLLDTELKHSELWSLEHNFCNSHPSLEGMEDYSEVEDELREGMEDYSKLVGELRAEIEDRDLEISNLQDTIDTLKEIIENN
jgi:hypothetical protein